MILILNSKYMNDNNIKFNSAIVMSQNTTSIAETVLSLSWQIHSRIQTEILQLSVRKT